MCYSHVIFDYKVASAASQSLPRMGNTLSMSHPGQSLNRGHICSLLIKNLISDYRAASASLSIIGLNRKYAKYVLFSPISCRDHIYNLLIKNNFRPKGRYLLTLTKNATCGTYTQVLPIGGIFAERCICCICCICSPLKVVYAVH